MKNIYALAYLHTFSHVSHVVLRRIWEYSKGEVGAFLNDLSREKLLAVGVSGEHVKNILDTYSLVEAERLAQYIEDMSIDIVLEHEKDFPDILRYVDPNPFMLYIRGNSDLFEERLLGVIGSRRASPYGISAVKYIVPPVIRGGVVVVSGLAMGIDGIAHQMAVDARVPTIAVMGTGVDVVYPSMHKKLAQEIIDHNGCLLSDLPLGTLPMPFNFPLRNRLISSLSHALLVIEAGEKSGTLGTVRCALEMGRDVFAVPGNIFSVQSKGTNTLLERAEAHPCVSAEGILDFFGIPRIVKVDEAGHPMLKYFREEFESKEVIFKRTEMSFEAFQAMVTELELLGNIEERSGWFRLL